MPLNASEAAGEASEGRTGQHTGYSSKRVARKAAPEMGVAHGIIAPMSKSRLLEERQARKITLEYAGISDVWAVRAAPGL